MAAHTSDFAAVPTCARHLYSEGGFVLHRRTLSSNPEPPKLLPCKTGHRRTCSNSAADFQHILSASPKSAEERKGVPREERDSQLVVIEPAPEQSQERRKKKYSFLGVLDAAINYLQTNPSDLSYSPSSADSPGPPLALLQERIAVLESENESLRVEAKRLTSQRENYVTHIGTLNTQLLDLQLALEEEKQLRMARSEASSFREASEKLDMSETSKPKVRVESPRSHRKPPTPSKPSARRMKALSPVSP